MRLMICAFVLCVSNAATATDLLHVGSGADTLATAGIVGLTPSPLTALSGNPALLGAAGNSTQVNLTTLYVDSQFRSSIGESAEADHGPGMLPELAISKGIPNTRWTWGAGFVMHSAMRADFSFVDPRGTLGVSYGEQTHRSEYVVAALRGGLAYSLNDSLTLGASLGLAYNRNELQAPYIFQSHQVLQGLKVLIDLDADDVALNAAFGLDYAITNDWKLNLAYSHETRFSADGSVHGNLGQLGLGIQEDFAYKANVKTALPSNVVGGVTWQVTDRLQLGWQYDWINWHDSFLNLPLHLTQGSNSDLNAFLGDNFISDTAPLNWHDQHVIHFGGKFLLGSARELRLGVEHGNAVVPRATVTPMTAAILETAFGVGMNINIAGTNVDVAYRLSEGSDIHVIQSTLQAGEYSGSRQSLRLHTLGISINF